MLKPNPSESNDSKVCRRLLLIEGDDGARRALQLLLQGHGFEVQSFSSARRALADPVCDEAGYLLVERITADADGLGVLGVLRGRGWQGRAVLMADAADAHREAGRLAGFAAVIDKPVRSSELLSALAG